MRKYLIYCLLFLTLGSCSSVNIENRIKKCVKDNYYNDIANMYDVKSPDFYNDILKIEGLFIKSKILNNNKQNSYYKLLDYLENIKTEQISLILDEIEQEFSKKNIKQYQYAITTTDIFSCPDVYLSKKINNNHPSRVIGIFYDDLRYCDFQNLKLLNYMFSLIKEKDFNKIVYRSYYILSIYFYLKHKKEL